MRLRRSGIAVAVAVAYGAAAAARPASATVPQGYTETTLATGLGRPVALAFLPDGRLLIGEQHTGRIKIFMNGAVQATPYATLSPIHNVDWESGLLGLCVHPDFANNGYVYVFATQTTTAQRIWRYTTVGNTGTSPTLIADNIPTRGVNHNGGGIGFGADGLLYAVVGDNAPPAAQIESQSTTSERGKVLRINADGTTPSDNPFGNRIWSIGHRHPFRLLAQPGTGKLFVSENGPSVDDEINVIVRGGNYGWPTVTGVAGNPSFRDPIAAYTPPPALVDLVFYRGTQLPFAGDLFFVEHKNGKVRRLTLGGTNGEQVVAGPSDFVTNVTNPVDLEEGPDGSLYYSTIGDGGSASGLLVRIRSSGAGNYAPSASFTVTPATGPPPLNASVDASASNDVDGSVSSYAWAWGDGSADGAGRTAAHTYAVAGTYTVRLTVTDNQGATGATTQSVIANPAGNTIPSSHIETATPAAGDVPLTVSFTGHGHDSAGEILELRWDFGDGSPADVRTGIPEGQNVALQHTYAAAGTFTCELRVKDPAGVTAFHTATIAAGRAVALAAGYTLVALPVTPAAPHTASTLAAEVNAQGGTCTAVIKYESGGFVTHPVGTGVQNFAIAAGKGYFLRCTAPGTWRPAGATFTAANADVPLVAGYNLVALPVERLTAFDAEAAADDINAQGGTATQVLKYEAGGFTTHPVNTGVNNFGLASGRGFFVRCTGASTWRVNR